MSTRKVPPSSKESASKRRRVQENMAPASGTTCCFDDLNNDCLVLLMSYLPIEDMNTVATLSQACCEARNNESLDQTRIATIVCSVANKSTLAKLREALNHARRTLNPNYTHLKIIGLNALEDDVAENGRMPLAFARLAHVTTLEISGSPNERNVASARADHALKLAPLLPNVRNLILGAMRTKAMFFSELCRHLQNLTRVVWRLKYFDIHGSSLESHGYFAELVLDGTCVMCHGDSLNLYTRDASPNPYLLMSCKHVERMSLKNVSWTVYGPFGESEPSIPQEVLMKMVRYHPSLRWLQSDLTEENVAILKQQYPEITFVSA